MASCYINWHNYNSHGPRLIVLIWSTWTASNKSKIHFMRIVWYNVEHFLLHLMCAAIKGLCQIWLDLTQHRLNSEEQKCLRNYLPIYVQQSSTIFQEQIPYSPQIAHCPPILRTLQKRCRAPVGRQWVTATRFWQNFISSRAPQMPSGARIY